jgi:hypothetical protein
VPARSGVGGSQPRASCWLRRDSRVKGENRASLSGGSEDWGAGRGRGCRPEAVTRVRCGSTWLREFAARPTPKDLLPLILDRELGDRTRARNSEFFIRHDAPAVQRYQLDLDALKG